MSSRPELQAPPEIFYDDTEARKYTSSSRIIEIQALLFTNSTPFLATPLELRMAKISERALELLALPDDGVPRLLLDIGCGSGLSGETLSENGHQWIGLDISESMLNVASERDVDGDLLLGDMGQGPYLSNFVHCGRNSSPLPLLIHCNEMVVFDKTRDVQRHSMLQNCLTDCGQKVNFFLILLLLKQLLLDSISHSLVLNLVFGVDQTSIASYQEMLICLDFQGLGLRPGVIDGAISISAVQAHVHLTAVDQDQFISITDSGAEQITLGLAWLCNADKSSHEPRLRLKAFFTSLYRCLARGARAVLQVYPENVAQRELILGFAMRAGFSGGVVVDFPHRKLAAVQDVFIA
ncbi:18S rRNA (guanine-N(7))-methyltransferase RID2 [Vitis vinifera]|uniref:18S rRNA (Guanine-N(7))-methyltransferase RID2 n=1 Tax=Vitis vinifera TaxID=29760 RepID=A0A438EE30_VITVI|nr:18S rRNA (guanine-N(7))-methyltransferase RID2 [Vitis vinifera]